MGSPRGEPLHQMGCLLLRRRAQVGARLLPRRVTGRRRGARALYTGFCSQAFRKMKYSGYQHASSTVGLVKCLRMLGGEVLHEQGAALLGQGPWRSPEGHGTGLVVTSREHGGGARRNTKYVK